MATENTKLVYISHSVGDHPWVDRLFKALAPYERDLGLEIWADTRSINPGDRWNEASKHALERSSVVVLLVSSQSFKSRFLMQQEWPQIQAAIKSGGPRAIVVPVSQTETPEWMGRYEWALGRGRTLDALDDSRLDNALADIARRISELAGPSHPRGSRRILVPDIAWVEIPGGPFVYQDSKKRKLDTFWIAKYPVTNLQYQAFINDGGYQEERWWRGLERLEPAEPSWKQANRPRTNVDWNEAMAFSRWLCARLGLKEGEIRLPSEEEWEKAARGPEGRVYPWGNEYRSGYANVNETREKAGPWNLEQTTAVGMYPHGATSNGVADLVGTVWEWALNKYDEPDNTVVDTIGDLRVLRGGSWDDNPGSARAGDRGRNRPGLRLLNIGFRLVSVVPIARAGR